MNILHLKYAVEIEKAGSLNRAAENLYMGQPNLSRAIKELESSLGIAIFERSSKGMVPTSAGEEFLRYAKKILREVDEIENLYKHGNRQVLKFSLSVPRASYISSAFVALETKLDTATPAEIYYKETNSLRTVKNVADGDYNLGIVRYSYEHDKQFREMLDERGLHHEPVCDFVPRLIMSRKHPLASCERIEERELLPYTLIAQADPYAPSIPTAALMREEPSAVSDRCIFVYERASQFELLSSKTDTYMWTSAVPTEMLTRYGLVERVCEGTHRKYRDVLIYRQDYKLSRLDLDFITELCTAKREIIDKQ